MKQNACDKWNKQNKPKPKIRVRWLMLQDPLSGDGHELHTEFQPSLGYTVRPCLKTPQEQKLPPHTLKQKQAVTENLSLPSTL